MNWVASQILNLVLVREPESLDGQFTVEFQVKKTAIKINEVNENCQFYVHMKRQRLRAPNQWVYFKSKQQTFWMYSHVLGHFLFFFVHFSTSCLFFRGSKICSDRSCDWTSLVERLYLTNVTSRLVVGRSVNPTNKQFVNVCKCCAAPRLPLIGFLFPNSSSRHGEKNIALQWYTTAAKQPIGLGCSLWKWATKADTLWNGFSGGLLRSRFCFADTHLYDYCVRLPWRGNVIMP